MDNRRLRALNDGAPRQDGDYVLYWMEHSQRAAENPALDRAVGWANTCGLPLFVLFVVDPHYPEGNARHFTFMLEGLKDAFNAIAERGAHAALRMGSPPEVASHVAQRAAVVVTDRGYLRHLRQWREAVADECGCLMEMVEGEAIVPVEEASPKRETAARTIRPKLMKAVDNYVEASRSPTLKISAKGKGLGHADDVPLNDVSRIVDMLGCDMSVAPVDHSHGGLSAARQRLTSFLKGDLNDYGDGRSDIVERHVSHLSPYLHLGHISPVEIYQKVKRCQAPNESKAAFVEEMVVRRELAINYVHHTADYDSYSALPEWARQSLEDHAKDEREVTFTAKELEACATDDPYWNAAMREMKVTGYLHNHLRMYWGKRIIGWMKSPETAFRTTLTLNNKYLLDGRDANSYANIGWLFGLHDRGWPERKVYGKVRIMMPSGLKRKFDVDRYVRWAEQL